MPGSPLVLSGITFRSRDALADHVRDRLKSLGPGPIPPGEDRDLFLALVARHPRASEKIGVGIDRLVIVQRDDASGPGLDILRVDKSRIDISCMKCIYGERSGQPQKAAFRRAIKDQIREFRHRAMARADAAGRVRCALSGRPISGEEAQVDHAWPNTFDALLRDFLRHEGLALKDIAVKEDPRVIGSRRIADHALEVRFQEWHRERARLRLVRGDLNMACGNERPSEPAVRRRIRRLKMINTVPPSSRPAAESGSTGIECEI